MKRNHLDGRPGLELVLLTVARQHRTLTGFAIKPLHPGIEAPKRLNEFYILPEDKSRESCEQVVSRSAHGIQFMAKDYAVYRDLSLEL